jgi:hypothetical protein
MIKNKIGEKVSAKVKAKLSLKEYLDSFSIKIHSFDGETLKDKEIEKINEQVVKIKERLNRALIIK